MKENSRATTRGRSAFGLSNALVIAQVVLPLVLVACAGLLVGTFRKLETLDPGFDHDHMLLMTVELRSAKSPKERRAEVYRDMMDRLREAPGGRSVSVFSMAPVSTATLNNDIEVDGFTPADRKDSEVFYNQVSAGYFDTMGTRLLAGRDFNDHDTPASPRVAVVNEAFGRKFFNSTDVIGRRSDNRDRGRWISSRSPRFPSGSNDCAPRRVAVRIGGVLTWPDE